MALIECPECSNEVSDMAEACPDCGYPISKEPGCPVCGSHDFERLAHLYESGIQETAISGMTLNTGGDIGFGSGTAVTASAQVKRLMQEHPVPKKPESGFLGTIILSIIVGLFFPPGGVGIFIVFGTIALIRWSTLPSKKQYQQQVEEFYSKFICHDCGTIHQRLSATS